MLKIFMWIGFTVIALIALLFAYAATLPDTFRVERSLNMKASPDKIVPLISDLTKLNQWNPFSKQDPSIKITYGQPSSGTGANYQWDSTGKAGKGDMRITEVLPSKVTMNLHMLKPMEANNTVVFAIQDKGGSSDVSWALSGAYPLINRVFGIVFNMDKMVGGEFEKGLADLKILAEK
jgi:Polyketide cyclase / dehydrase and lipid transport